MTQLFQLLRTHLCYDTHSKQQATSSQSAAAAAAAGGSAAWLRSAQAASSIPAAVLDAFADSSDGSDSDEDDKSGAGNDRTATASPSQRRRAEALACMVWALFDVLFAADSGAVLGLLQDSRTLQGTAWQSTARRGRSAAALAWEAREGKGEETQGLRYASRGLTKGWRGARVCAVLTCSSRCLVGGI